jgi:hypothetical protein
MSGRRGHAMFALGAALVALMLVASAIPPASAGVVAANRSGLPWRSGVFPETYQSAAQADAFGTWRGRPVDVAVTAVDRSTWDKMTRDIFVLSPSFFPRTWPGQLVISVAPWPTNQGNMAGCAAGNYNGRFETLGTTLVNNGRGTAIIRLAWEFNGNWMEWSAHDPQQFKTCFRNLAQAIKRKAPAALIDWTAGAGETVTCGGSVFNCYPGNDVVDIIGADYYDMWGPHLTPAQFDFEVRRKDSLYPMLDFARRNGKRFAVGEWGVVTKTGNFHRDHREQLGGDNPVFIDQMVRFFRANAADIAYEAYFNTCNKDQEVGSDLHVCGPINPVAAAKYQQVLR